MRHHQLSQYLPQVPRWYRMPLHDVGPIRMLCNASPWAQPQERIDSRGPAILSFVMPSCGRPERARDCGLQQAVSEHAGLGDPSDLGIEAGLRLRFAEALAYSTPITVPQYKLPTSWNNREAGANSRYWLAKRHRMAGWAT
ncbi:hypothetical protein EDB85DRAFT_2274099 [Lactarius pseudohatsudake]|nr:hypothetical protein EDB85DRAFT_2274099 [Lactarius pseudohatsudake]